MVWATPYLKNEFGDPRFFYVFYRILSFATVSQSFKKICVWEVFGRERPYNVSENKTVRNFYASEIFTILCKALFCAKTLSFPHGANSRWMLLEISTSLLEFVLFSRFVYKTLKVQFFIFLRCCFSTIRALKASIYLSFVLTNCPKVLYRICPKFDKKSTKTSEMFCK